MSCDSDECADVYNDFNRRARKEHKCCACRETIRRGDLYQVTNIVFDGSADTYKHCLRCARMLSVLVLEHRTRQTGESAEIELNCGHSWQDVFEEAPPDEVARLAFMTPDEMQAEFAK